MILSIAMMMAQVQSAAVAQPPKRTVSPNFLPLTVRQAIVAVNAQCKEAGGRPGQSSSLITFVDLTGDGVIDYVMDLAKYDCQGAASAVSAGDSGNGVTIFVGGPNNTAFQAYDATTQGVEVTKTGATAKVSVTVMGLDCGDRNAAHKAMSDVEVCSRPLVWLPTQRKFVMALLSQKRRISAQ